VVLEVELVTVLGVGLLGVSVAEAVGLLEVVRVELGLARGWSAVGVAVASLGDVVAWDDTGRVVLAASGIVVVTIGDACRSVSNSSIVDVLGELDLPSCSEILVSLWKWVLSTTQIVTSSAVLKQRSGFWGSCGRDLGGPPAGENAPV